MVAVGSGERVVAGWILERRLGSGGYGQVWQARRRHVDLVRALKLIPISSEGAFESWRHEIGRLEALNHPNVVRFYDADIVSEGLFRDHAWIATELCERSLADGLRRRERHVLPYADGEALLDAMLAALGAAHAAGMVHRDIKPANILRHRDGTWKLCDFGTARLVPADATHPVTQVVGTSPYMSPAAHRGQQNQAADLYALGVTIHEALRGERLHPRPEGMTDGEYIRIVLDTPPAISPDLPRRWQTVVAALIGDHGALSAAQLAEWFGATRGDRPPAMTTPAAPGAAGVAGVAGTAVAAGSAAGGPPARPVEPATGATVAANAVGGPAPAAPARPSGAAAPAPEAPAGGTVGPPTGPTALAGALAAGSPPAARETRRVHVPAPKADTPPPPPAPPAGRSPAGSANGANGAAGPVAVRPPAPAPAPPSPPSPWPAARPAAPQPTAPPRPPIWIAAAVDPTAPLGRRVFAVLVDWSLIFMVAGVLFVAAVVSAYDPLPRPSSSGSGSVEATCSTVDASASCHKIGDTVYVSASVSLAYMPFAVVSAALLLVVLQGLTGATVGKFLVGLRVVDRNGRPPGVLRAFARTALLLVDAFPFGLPLVGWLVAVNNARHRRVGDFAAGTMVVRRRALAHARY